MKTSIHKHLFAVSLLTALGQPLLAAPAALVVDVDKPGHPVPATLWGIFFEDINLSADGGLYAELVRNRNFEDSDQPAHWTAIGSGAEAARFSVDTARPVSPKNPRSLKVTIAPSGGTRAGVANGGFYGMGIAQGETYKLSLLARGGDGFSGPLTISLESAESVPYATATLPALTGDWKNYTFALKASASDPKARLVISATQAGTFWLDMVSLFPEKTWKGHGLRPDLAEMLVGLKPAFMRFPGGCWVEGDTMKEAYRWKQTIGDPSERRTQHNIWAYEATHGLGFHEYLQLCEDLNAAPLFCINVGMSHRENVPLDQMGEYVQDALDAIEYANGPADSTWGALRAKAGHPAPFNLQYLEIGNENGGPAYHERYALFVKAILARYPQMHLVANVWNGSPKDSPVEILDEHYYSTPDFFIRQADKYDSYKRNDSKIFVGEYAVTQNAGLGNLRGAIGEAVFMTGMERNSDVVVMAAYAPLFCNANHKRWPINLINFDSTRNFGLPSYYVQQLFAQHRGDVVLPVAVSTPVVNDSARGGGVGVGTWLTQAEFKDMKVTRDGKTLFAADPAQGTGAWRLLDGDWKIQDGTLRQNSLNPNVRALVGDKTWTDYTYTLKARKLSGQEGFLIPFLITEDESKCWWNIGGWGNTRSALEMDGVTAREEKCQIETGRWYDIRIEVHGSNIKCYLDQKLIHEAKATSVKSLHASATRDLARGDVIIKVVNASADAQPAEIKLNGITQATSPAQALVLTSEHATDENTLGNPTKVVPVSQALPLTGTTLSHTFPGNSLTVIRVNVNL
jgi:alpha-L-arabinofuranosidase